MKKKIPLFFIIIFLVINYYSFAQENLPKDSISFQFNDTLLLPSTEYQWISYQLKTKILQDEEAPVQLQIYFVNRIDSIIYLNFSKMGIELLRMCLTPEEVIYVNKLDETFYQGDYENFHFFINITFDFYFIQSLFNGVDFKNFSPPLTFFEKDTLYHFSTSERKCRKYDIKIMQDIFLNEDFTIKRNEIIDLSSMSSLDIHYDNYQNFSSIPFFTKLQIVVDEDDMIIQGDLKNIKFNIPGPTQIRIPSKFKPLK